jgi:hypothetical protein
VVVPIGNLLVRNFTKIGKVFKKCYEEYRSFLKRPGMESDPCRRYSKTVKTTVLELGNGYVRMRGSSEF